MKPVSFYGGRCPETESSAPHGVAAMATGPFPILLLGCRGEKSSSMEGLTSLHPLHYAFFQKKPTDLCWGHLPLADGETEAAG